MRLGLEFHLSNLIDDFRIGQRRDVSGILVVRDGRKHAAHDLAGAGLRHVGHDHDTARAGNRPNLTNHGALHALAHFLARFAPRLERYVKVRDLAFDLVSGGDHGCLGDLLNQQAGGFDLLGPESMPGDIDDIVNSTEDAVVAIAACKAPSPAMYGQSRQSRLLRFLQ